MIELWISDRRNVWKVRFQPFCERYWASEFAQWFVIGKLGGMIRFTQRPQYLSLYGGRSHSLHGFWQVSADYFPPISALQEGPRHLAARSIVFPSQFKLSVKRSVPGLRRSDIALVQSLGRMLWQLIYLVTFSITSGAYNSSDPSADGDGNGFCLFDRCTGGRTPIRFSSTNQWCFWYQ